MADPLFHLAVDGLHRRVGAFHLWPEESENHNVCLIGSPEPRDLSSYKGENLVALIHGVSQIGKHPLPPQVLPDDADVPLVVAGGDHGPELLGVDEGAGLARPVGEIGLDRNETFHGVFVDRYKTAKIGQIDGVARFFSVMNEVSNHVRFLLAIR